MAELHPFDAPPLPADPAAHRLRAAQMGCGRVTLTFADGLTATYSLRWLVDHDPAHRHPETNQRLREAQHTRGDHPGLSSPPTLSPDGAHLTLGRGADAITHHAAWLRAHAPAVTAPTASPWSAALAATLPRVERAALDDPATARDAERALLTHLTRLGFVVVGGVPATPPPGHASAVAAFARRFGHVRPTNYGEHFDVRTVLDADHLAYTGVALAPHTDNPYRDAVPGVQLLHCLRPAPRGGDTVLVDGFWCVERLRATDPAALEVLTRVRVPFRYRDAHTDLRFARPLIELDEAGNPLAVAFNDRSMAPLRLPAREVDAFYAAYDALAAQVHDPQNALVFPLAAGDLLVFDNRRLLHGRTAIEESPGTERLLQGCYADRDAFDGRLRVIARP